MHDNPVRVFIIGAGMVTPFHIRGWQALPGVKVVGICSRSGQTAQARAAEFNIPDYFENVEAGLAATEPTVVDICSPQESHLEHVRLALSAGAHIMCQKPLAPDMEQALAIARLAKDSRQRFMVHENFRFRPWNRMLKKLLAEGAIGQPFYLHSNQRQAGTVTSAAFPEIPWGLARQPYFRDLPRFLLLESVIHQIDVARMLLGQPERIYARLRRISPLVKGEDMVTVCLSFPGAEALLERSYGSRGYADPPSPSETIALEGERGTIFVDRDGRMELSLDMPGHRERREIPVDLTDSYAASYAATIAHFVEQLRNGGEFETDLHDNLCTLAATLAGYESASKGQAVELGARLAQLATL